MRSSGSQSTGEGTFFDIPKNVYKVRSQIMSLSGLDHKFMFRL